VVAFHMSHYRQFIRIMQIAPNGDRMVLVTCFAFTILIDMVAGVTVGIVLSCFLLMQRVARLTHSQVSDHSGGHHRKLRHLRLPEGVMVYHINGLVFFGTVEKALERISFITDDIHTLIIDMEDVPLVDMTGLVALKTMIMDIHSRNQEIILCGNAGVIGKVMQKLPLSARHRLKTAETIDQAIALVSQEQAD
jgi:sulfate permease, SulP family